MTWQQFADIEERLALRRTVVLFVTLWVTWRAFEWAAMYAYALIKADNSTMVAAAAMIAAVTAPISYLQKAVFQAYIEAKREGAGDASSGSAAS